MVWIVVLLILIFRLGISCQVILALTTMNAFQRSVELIQPIKTKSFVKAVKKAKSVQKIKNAQLAYFVMRQLVENKEKKMENVRKMSNAITPWVALMVNAVIMDPRLTEKSVTTLWVAKTVISIKWYKMTNINYPNSGVLMLLKLSINMTCNASHQVIPVVIKWHHPLLKSLLWNANVVYLQRVPVIVLVNIPKIIQEPSIKLSKYLAWIVILQSVMTFTNVTKEKRKQELS